MLGWLRRGDFWATLGRFKKNKYHEAYDVNTTSRPNALRFLLIMQIGKRRHSGSTFSTQNREHWCRSTCEHETRLQPGGKKHQSIPMRHATPGRGFRPAVHHLCRRNGIPAGKMPQDEPGPPMAPLDSARMGPTAKRRAGESPRCPSPGCSPRASVTSSRQKMGA